MLIACAIHKMYPTRIDSTNKYHNSVSDQCNHHITFDRAVKRIGDSSIFRFLRGVYHLHGLYSLFWPPNISLCPTIGIQYWELPHASFPVSNTRFPFLCENDRKNLNYFSVVSVCLQAKCIGGHTSYFSYYRPDCKSSSAWYCSL